MSWRRRVERIGARHGLTLECPPPRLCTDNAAMIAWTAIEYAMRDGAGVPPEWSAGSVEDDDPYSAQIQPRWPLGKDYREWPDKETTT